ncbi:prolyl-tRNA synthetase [Hypoxylon sp. FL1284]|nr:prolyl-tRNA synthetase [Hypoxylon sp. FL1284]
MNAALKMMRSWPSSRRNHQLALKLWNCHNARLSGTRSAPTSIPLEFQVQESFTRRSKFWIPAKGITPSKDEDTLSKLSRAGYHRQSHAGIFNLLPLGQRVQEKIERLIDKYMLQLGASKVSLTSISSQALWQQTNRLEGYGQELFRFSDRKDVPFLLAPTHEEEITTLVSMTVKSYKTLPLRLYQIGRKYRDEIRPRHGFLRSREFLMKDLYTFDDSTESALSSYEQVRAAYSRLFDELKLPYLVAEASSGDIGGDLSHEYHLPASIGEDNVISCNSCDYVANEEVATTKPSPLEETTPSPGSGDVLAANVWRGITKDRSTLVNVWYPASSSGDCINTHAVKSVLPELDASLTDPIQYWSSTEESSEPRSHVQLVNLVDGKLGPAFARAIQVNPTLVSLLPEGSSIDLTSITTEYVTTLNDKSLNLLRIQDGDNCPRCSSGKLKVHKAVELGHTFHLGTRYSEPLGARVSVPANSDSATKTKEVPMQMGCHGIGVSRIIGAVADHLADEKGLNWPRSIAPFEVVVIPGKGLEDDGVIVSEYLANSQVPRPLDLLLDDRPESLPFRMKDADLVGYPVIVVLGKGWSSDRLCEVQCRRLSSVSHTLLSDLPMHINQLLAQL